MPHDIIHLFSLLNPTSMKDISFYKTQALEQNGTLVQVNPYLEINIWVQNAFLILQLDVETHNSGKVC